mgnify:CR=1 FL=1
MAGRRAPSRQPTVFAQVPSVSDAQTQRALDVINSAVLDLQARRLLEQFTATTSGYVPESGGGEFDFLAADGTWKTIVGSGAVDSVTAGSAMVDISPNVGAVVVDVVPANFTGIPMTGITFAGTNNRVSKFSGTQLADSTISDSGVLVTINNALKVTGAADFDSTFNADGAVTMMSTADVAGNFSVATSKFTVNATTGNAVVAGTLAVTGAITEGGVAVLSGAITANTIPKGSSGNLADSSLTDDGTTFAVNTNKFTVVEASGNTLVAGTLDATGNFRVNTNKFTVTASSGNTLVAGTLDVTGNVLVNTSKFVVTATTGTAAIAAGGSLFVGASALTKAFPGIAEVTKDGDNTITSSAYGTSVTPEVMVFRGRGTGASTTAVLSGDLLGQFAFTGATSATGFFSGVLLESFATENWSSTNKGSRFELYTTATGGSTRTAQFTVQNDGGCGIGPTFTPDPSVNLHVRRADAAGVPAANTSTVLHVENSAATYITISAADSSDHGILFARTNSNADGSILYDNSGVTRGFDFRTGGNTSRVTIDSSGNVLAKFNLSVNGNTVLGDTTSDTTTINGNNTINHAAAGGLLVNGPASNYALTRITSFGGAGNGFAARLELVNTNAVTAEFRMADTGSGTTFNAEASMLTTSVGAGYGMKFNVNAASNSGIRIASGSPGAVTVYGTTNLQGAVDCDTTLNVDGNCTFGDATSDTVTIAGLVGINGASAATNAVTVTGPASGTAIRINNASSGQTSSNGSDHLVIPSGSFDTTAGNLTHTAVRVVSSLTRSAGSNALLQIGHSAEISSGQDRNRGFSAVVSGATATSNVGVYSSASGSSGTNYSWFSDAGIMHQVGDFDINTNKFTIAGASGNTVCAGTMGVTGDFAVNTSKFTVTASSGNTVVAGTLDVTGTTTLKGTAVVCDGTGDTLKFYGGTGATQQTVTGSRGGNAALADLLTKLATLGLIVDSTS